jgi:xylulokinase
MTNAAFLGIDVGTSTTKSVIVSESGAALASSLVGYDIETPSPGAAEEDPQTWWDAVVRAVGEARAKAEGAHEIRAIGLSGQMHSAVFLGESREVLRPAILWADTRAAAQSDFITKTLSDRGLFRVVKNPVPVGFTAPSILWVREREPAVFRRVRTVIQPKDYIRMRLVGEVATDSTDASATGLFDIAGRAWSQEVLDALDIPRAILPEVHNSAAVAGALTDEAASALSLGPGLPVVYGGGDQPVGAVGNGIVSPERGSLTVGTGGQVLVPARAPGATERDGKFAIHTFCHCPEGLFYHMGATLAAGLSLKWFRNNLGGGESFAALDKEAEGVPAGSEGLIFLPYLLGERTPHMDVRARGLFFGIGLAHTRGHFARAVMEGVAFSIREALEAVARAAPVPDELVMSGGGGKSSLWPRIIADVLGVRVRFPAADEGSAYGAALLAAVGSGTFGDIDEAAGAWVRYRDEAVVPEDEHRATYDASYNKYRELYRRLSPDLF